MSNIDLNQVVPAMVTAAGDVLGEKWPIVKDYAAVELEKIKKTFVLIETLKQKPNTEPDQKISDDDARILLEMQKNTARAVMLSLEGMSLLIVEAAIKAALDVVSTSINTAVGFALL